MQIIKKSIGIDLGTTNSAAGVMNRSDTAVVIHQDPVSKGLTTPSCVWRDPKRGEFVVGRKAYRRIGMEPAPISSIKRLMGTSERVVASGQTMTPEEVSALILGELRSQIAGDVGALAQPGSEWRVDRAIVTKPAYFDEPQIAATRRAAEMAGLELLELLDEPVAAATYHCWANRKRDGVFMVYDLGGGTFDVSIVRFVDGEPAVLGTSGHNRLGGDDLDATIANHLIERLCADDWNMQLDRDDPDDWVRFAMVKLLAENVKKGLSTETDYLLRDGSLRDKDDRPVVIETVFERPEVEAIMLPIIERTIPYCDDAIGIATKRAGVRLRDIDEIVLAGGSTHIPLVRDVVRHHFCAGPRPQVMPSGEVRSERARCDEPSYGAVDTMVAGGAAVRAASIGGLTIQNEDESLTIVLKGTGASVDSEADIGGTVKAVGVDLDGAVVHMRSEVEENGFPQAFEDDAELDANGDFFFMDVPVQTEESTINFEVRDASGVTIGSFERDVKQDLRGGIGEGTQSTDVLAKSLGLEVERGGRTTVSELFPAMTALPARESFTFAHPGTSEVKFDLYQRRRLIHSITVKVPPETPRGKPIHLDVAIDKFRLMTVDGRIGEVGFDTVVEPPPERPMPTQGELTELEARYTSALEYPDVGVRMVAQAKWLKAFQACQAAIAGRDQATAVHEFEELEAIVYELEESERVLEPQKSVFDDLVKECLQLNQEAAKGAGVGAPHDEKETERAIAVQREAGDSAHDDGDQAAYTEAIRMLNGIRNHLLDLGGDGGGIVNPEQEARHLIKTVEHNLPIVLAVAAEQDRRDIRNDLNRMFDEIPGLLALVKVDPRSAAERASGMLQTLAGYARELGIIEAESGPTGRGSSGPGRPEEVA